MATVQWGRQVAAVGMPAGRAELALNDLIALPMTRSPHRPLTPRCWDLRADLTAYDASYVALAELLGVDLVTADRRLASAPGLRCRVDVRR